MLIISLKLQLKGVGYWPLGNQICSLAMLETTTCEAANLYVFWAMGGTYNTEDYNAHSRAEMEKLAIAGSRAQMLRVARFLTARQPLFLLFLCPFAIW